MSDQPESEDDVAEMVDHLAYQVAIYGCAGEAIKQQFRDALTKFVDARIAEAMARK